MKQSITLLIAFFLCLAAARAMSPETKVPPAPQVSAIKAIGLADAFLGKKFSKENSPYCQSASLKEAVMAPVGGERHWDLVYRQAGAEREVDPKDGAERFNDFHVYVTMAGEISLEWPVKSKTDRPVPSHVKIAE